MCYFTMVIILGQISVSNHQVSTLNLCNIICQLYLNKMKEIDTMQGGQLSKHGNRNIMIIKLEVSNTFNSIVLSLNPI